MIDTRPWFERWPQLRAWELERFQACGLVAEVKPSQADQLVVCCTVRFRGEDVEIRVIYPSEYPELPPAVYGPPGLLERHQHRFGGNFCLLERPLDDWPARDWGAADLIAERLTALLIDTEAGPERVRGAEAPMPEPVSAYFQPARGVAVLIPGAVLPLGERGTMRVRRAAPNIFLVEAAGDRQVGDELLSVFPSGDVLEVPWFRLDGPPPAGPDGAAVAAWVRSQHPQLLARDLPPRLRGSSRLPQPPDQEMCALVFPEEGPAVGEQRDAYLFVLVDRTTGTPQEHLVHAQVVSEEERGQRIPELAGLPDRRVLIVGVGALGGEVALALARASTGTLDLVDWERFEFGNTVRHPLGLEYCGHTKTIAVAQACRRANPFCRVATHENLLGDTTWPPGASPIARLAPLIDAADLVVEGTGSHQIAQLLGRLSAEAGTPLVSGWMTDGYHGAEIVRILPRRTCCWTCFATAAREGCLHRAATGPPSQVTAQGCSHPTTTGAGFDAAEVAAVLARLAVQTLAPDGGYPDSPWDHAAISFRADGGEYPRFAAERLPPPDDSCEQCCAAAGVLSAR